MTQPTATRAGYRWGLVADRVGEDLQGFVSGEVRCRLWILFWAVQVLLPMTVANTLIAFLEVTSLLSAVAPGVG